jgi:hypothetical protein
MKNILLALSLLPLLNCASYQVSDQKNFWSKTQNFIPFFYTSEYQYCVAHFDEKTGTAFPVCYKAVNAKEPMISGDPKTIESQLQNYKAPPNCHVDRSGALDRQVCD